MFGERFWINGLSILVFMALLSLILGVISGTILFTRWLMDTGSSWKRRAVGLIGAGGGVERKHTKLRTLSEMLLEVYSSMTLSECVDMAHMGKNSFPIAKLGYG